MAENGSVLIVGVGAVRGLGAALGRTFAAAGFTVVLAGRNKEKLEAAALDIKERGGVAFVEVGDAAEPEDVTRFVGRAEAVAPLRVAIHNAGGNRPAPFLQVQAAVFEEHWRAHALGGFLLAQAALPPMLARGEGTLLFTGASGSLRGRANFVPFSAAKAAVRMIAQSLAREFGPLGIHVGHIVVDGAIDGDRIRAFFKDADQRWGEDGMLAPEAIAEAYLALHRQHRSAWTQELDVRPWRESF